MKAYLKACDLWDVVEVVGDPPMQRHANPTLAQIKQRNEEIENRYKALSCPHSTISKTIFAKIMNYDDLNKFGTI